MGENKVVLITGTRKGIGRALVEHYAGSGYHVIGCSRSPFEAELPNYRHCCVDVGDEPAVKRMFSEIRKQEGRLDAIVVFINVRLRAWFDCGQPQPRTKKYER
jgi:3-oxoacyl-[acyl-carrier protein] reductase